MKILPAVDLINCDREPIRIPGSIQPHGVLLVLDEQLRIARHSANASAKLDLPQRPLLGAALGEILSDASTSKLEAMLKSVELDLNPIYLSTIETRYGRQAYNAIAHRNGAHRIVELEPAEKTGSAGDHNTFQLTRSSMVACRRTIGVVDLAQCIADQIRTLNGFDRVMVYQFDAEWNGEVVAEARRDDLETFLHLHYPASDIPVQARELYTKNWLRFITDREYVPCPIHPASDPSSADPLDMSFCVLRSVSPIHIEYLRNMGVGASMSISLMRDGRLWGMVACHHYSPRFVPYDVRVACEHLGQVMSLQLAANEQAQFQSGRDERAEGIKRIVEGFRPSKFADSLQNHGDDLLRILNAGGAAIMDGDVISRVGQTPSDDDIRLILNRLPSPGEEEFVALDHLRELLNESRLDPIAAGVLVISLNRFARRAIALFRPEVVRSVHWAGDPAKSVVKGDDGVRLSPRGSFALWKQTVRGRSEQWTTIDQSAARNLRRELSAKLVSYVEELTHHNFKLQEQSLEKEAQLASEREARSQAERLNKLKDDFVATLSHELRTPLNAIIGWAHLLGRNAALSVDDRQAITVIDRNARAQAQMIEDLLDMSRIAAGKLRLDVQQMHLPPIVDSAIATVKPAADAKQVSISSVLDPMVGVTVSGDPQRLQQVAWNLLSNAVKFTPKGGKIRVQLLRINSHVELIISDNGSGISPEFLPHVFDRFRQADATSTRSHSGLGLGLSIVRHLIELHGGTAVAYSEGLGKGSSFTISLPIRAVSKSAAAAEIEPENTPGVNLQNVRVLVVDDEPDARELLRRVLLDCKATVEAAESVSKALEILRTHKFDVLISDIGMQGEDGYSLIRKLREFEAQNERRKLPAIALTAYARAEDRRKIIMSGFQVHVAKPVEPTELLAVVASLANRL